MGCRRSITGRNTESESAVSSWQLAVGSWQVRHKLPTADCRFTIDDFSQKKSHLGQTGAPMFY